MVTLDNQCARAKVNHRAWLEVTHCLDQTESVQEYLRMHRQGLVTSAPDPLSLCAGSSEAAGWNFDKDNARVFPCISEVVNWCDPSPTSAAAGDDTRDPPVPPSSLSTLASAGRVQILVTGSLHLVGAAMNVLGCKIEDL